MLQALNSLSAALRDTLIQKAGGRALDRLSGFYGIPRARAFSDAVWRSVLRSVVFGARGTPGVTLDFLSKLYTDQTEKYTVTVTHAHPSRVWFSSGPGSAWGARHLHRLCRVRFIPRSALPLDAGLVVSDPEGLLPWRSQLFFSSGPYLSGAATSGYLELSPYRSGYWAGCNWASGENAVDIISEPFSVTAYLDLLPFFVTEPTPGPAVLPRPHEILLIPGEAGAPCVFRLYVDGSVLSSPASYLLEGVGVDRDTVDVNMPDQGHMFDELNVSGGASSPAEGDQVDGPRPLYLAGDVRGGVAKLLDPLLAAGVQAEELPFTFGGG